MTNVLCGDLPIFDELTAIHLMGEFFTRAASKFSCTDDERPTISEKQGEYFTSLNPFKLIPDASKSSRVCIAGVAQITQQYPFPTISSPLTKDQRPFF